jgi:hypothetical protein
LLVVVDAAVELQEVDCWLEPSSIVPLQEVSSCFERGALLV